MTEQTAEKKIEWMQAEIKRAVRFVSRWRALMETEGCL